MEEKRKYKRMDINVKIKLNEIKNTKDVSMLNKEYMEVDLVNVSRGGIAFRSSEELILNTFYDVKLILRNNDKLDAIVEIIRMENKGDEQTLYGCRYIGMMPRDSLRIQVQELIMEAEKNS